MFDVSLGELAIVAVVAVVAIGPKELPTVLRAVARLFSQLRGLAGEFRQGVDTLLQESELLETKKQFEEHFIIDQNGERQRVYDISDVTDVSPRIKPTAEEGTDDGA